MKKKETMNKEFKTVLFIFGILSLFLFGCGSHRANNSAAGTSFIDENMSSVSGNKEADSAKEQDVDEDFDEFSEEFDYDSALVADPLAPWNRAMFYFNDKLYFWVLKPVASGYKAIVPQELRGAVKNFFHNLNSPCRIVSCLLQGKFRNAGIEFLSFLYNTTAGVFGFGNPAKDYLGLDPGDEDLGQTLGAYGIGHGVYIVWPLLGPSTLRDSIGMVGDGFMNPTFYVEPSETAMAVSAGEAVNTTSLKIGQYETLKKAAIEPYEAARDASIMYRNKKVEE